MRSGAQTRALRVPPQATSVGPGLRKRVPASSKLADAVNINAFWFKRFSNDCFIDRIYDITFMCRTMYE